MYAANRDNPWVKDLRGTHRRWRAWFATGAAVAFSLSVLETFKSPWGVSIQQGIASMVRWAPGPWEDILSSGALQALIFGLFLAAALAATGLEGRRPWRREGISYLDIPAGLAIGGLGYCATAAIAALAGAIAPAPAVATASPLAGIAFGAGVVALQSVSEEAFFRGWLQPVLCTDWGPRVGLVVTSALFAGLHIVAGAQGWMAVLNLFLGGLLFGLLALRTGNLLAPAAAHFAWNWTESGILGLSWDPAGSLVSLKFIGSPLWNGGPDAMNGSLATTIVLVALVGIGASLKPKPKAS